MRTIIIIVAITLSMPIMSQTEDIASIVCRAQVEWLPLLPPVETIADDGFCIDGIVPLGDAKEIGEVGSKHFNRFVSEEIRRQLAKKVSGVQTTLTSLRLTYYDVPSGNQRQNVMRGNMKIQNLKNYLTEQLLASSVTVNSVAEDWDRIMVLTAADNTIRLQAAALDIMRNVGVSDGREAQLKTLAGGETFRQLQQRVFPQVRRIAFTAILNRQADVPSVADTPKVSLTALFATACQYRRGTTEFNDIIDLTARLYPDNAEACVNAAGVALLKGDVEKAEYYLGRWMTVPQAYQHAGVLYYLLGDMGRAEVYLRMAEARGVSEARVVLNKMNQD